MWLIEKEINPFLDFRQPRKDGRNHPNSLQKKNVLLWKKSPLEPKKGSHSCVQAPAPSTFRNVTKILQGSSSPEIGRPVSACCSFAVAGIEIAWQSPYLVMETKLNHYGGKLNHVISSKQANWMPMKGQSFQNLCPFRNWWTRQHDTIKSHDFWVHQGRQSPHCKNAPWSPQTVVPRASRDGLGVPLFAHLQYIPSCVAKYLWGLNTAIK